MNIIIVDDDKLVSLSLKTILEASGEVNVCAIGTVGRRLFLFIRNSNRIFF